MYEVLETVSKLELLMGLFIIAWFDYKTKLIELKRLLLFGAAGIAKILLQGDFTVILQGLNGIWIGIGILLFAWISEESIGFGDGLLFVMTGIYLGFIKNLVLLLGSLFLAGIVAIGCLIVKRVRKTDRLALAPFVLTAYVVFVL